MSAAREVSQDVPFVDWCSMDGAVEYMHLPPSGDEDVVYLSSILLQFLNAY